MARTDLHRPSTIVPGNYRFVAMNYFGPSAEDIYSVNEGRKVLRADMERTGGKYAHVEHSGNGGSCDVCGAHALYVGIFHYALDNTYITLGHECVAKLELAMGDGVAFRKEVKRGLEAVAGKKKAVATLEAAGLLRAWEIYNMTFEQLLATGGVTVKKYRNSEADGTDNTYHDYSYEENTIRDIVRKLVGWGSLSDAQTNFLRNLLAKIDTREQRKVERAAQDAAAKPLPKFEGRTQITGKVLATKIGESQFGVTRKMLVQHADGWKVWGSVPSEWHGQLDSLKGTTVTFFAKVEPSQDDPKFGYFSRPTKAALVTQAEAA